MIKISVARFGTVVTAAVTAVTLASCSAIDDSVVPQSAGQAMLSVTNSVNVKSFVQSFPLGNDVYYAAVTADRQSIAIFHQNPDFTLGAKPILSLTNDTGLSVQPGSIRVTEPYSTAGGQGLALTAVTGQGTQITTWNVLYDPDNGNLTSPGQLTWGTAPSAGLTVQAIAVSQQALQLAGSTWAPSRVFVDWAAQPKAGAHSGIVYSVEQGAASPSPQPVALTADQAHPVWTVRMKVPGAGGSQTEAWGFSYLDAGPQLRLWDDDGNPIAVDQAPPVAGAEQAMVSSFASVLKHAVDYQATSTIDVCRRPLNIVMTPDQSTAYAACRASAVAVIDTATSTVRDTISFPRNQQPTTVGVTEDGTRLLVASMGSGTLTVVDTATNAVVGTVPVGFRNGNIAISPDQSTVFVPSPGSSSISVVDLANPQKADSIPVGANPAYVTFAPDGARAYAANLGDDTVSVIDTAQRKVVQTATVSDQPTWIGVKPDGTAAYVTNSSGKSVSVLDTTSPASPAVTIRVGGSPAFGAITPDGSKVYVTGPGTGPNKVSVIDTSSNTVTAQLDAGQLPDSLSMSKDGSLIYVGCEGSSDTSLPVIDTATNAVTLVDVGTATGSAAIRDDDSQAFVTNPAANTVTVIGAAPAPRPAAGSRQVGVVVDTGKAQNPYAMNFFELVWSDATKSVSLQEIPGSALTLQGISSSEDLSYGDVGIAGVPTPLYVNVQQNGGQNVVVTADGSTGAPVPDTDFVPALQNDLRSATGTSTVGNYLGGFAALAGITNSGQLGLYGYNAGLKGFDTSRVSDPSTKLAVQP